MNVLALDLSLTATGVAFPDGYTDTWKVNATGTRRLALLRERLASILDGAPIDLVVIEEYAFSRATAHSHELGEWGGVARMVLHDRGQPWIAIKPSNLKRFATGKGNASKEEVLVAAVKRLGYDGSSNDEADALWLRQMALDHYGHAAIAMPANHREALAVVDWPPFGMEPAA